MACRVLLATVLCSFAPVSLGLRNNANVHVDLDLDSHKMFHESKLWAEDRMAYYNQTLARKKAARENAPLPEMVDTPPGGEGAPCDFDLRGRPCKPGFECYGARSWDANCRAEPLDDWARCDTDHDCKGECWESGFGDYGECHSDYIPEGRVCYRSSYCVPGTICIYGLLGGDVDMCLREGRARARGFPEWWPRDRDEPIPDFNKGWTGPKDIDH